VSRQLPEPPKSPDVDPRAAAIVDAIKAYAEGRDSDLDPAAIALGMHHINYAANQAFALALSVDKKDTEGRTGTTWDAMAKRHQMSPSSLQWRVYRHEGRIPERWAPGKRKSRATIR
jgi:hypothetical protein